MRFCEACWEGRSRGRGIITNGPFVSSVYLTLFVSLKVEFIEFATFPRE